MRRYKVIFKGNKALSANPVEEEPFEKYLEINIINNKKNIESFIVWGIDEADAIEVADKVIKDFSTLL